MNITKFITPSKQVIIGHTVETPAGTFWRSTLKPSGTSDDGRTTDDYSRDEIKRANEQFGSTIGQDAEAWAKKQQG